MHVDAVGQIAICQMASAESRVVMLGKVALANGLGMKVGGIFADSLIGRFGCVLKYTSLDVCYTCWNRVNLFLVAITRHRTRLSKRQSLIVK